MSKKSIGWSSRTAWALVVGGTWLGVSGLTGMPFSGASQFGAARAQAFENGASENAAPDNEASTKTNSDGGSIRQAPRALKPGDRGVGRQAGDGAWVDLDGKRGRVSELTGKPGQLTVFAWTSTSCPLSKKYLPVLSRLEQQFAPRGVKFVLVNPVASDSVDSMREARKSHAFQAIYLKDAEGAVSKALGATTTTDVIVLDAARTVVYHGAVDDQYGLGYSMEQARHAYLSEALSELLAGKTPRIAATDAPGCALEWAESESSAAKNDAAASSVTYHNRISRIVNQYCVECHRAGGLAPFSLTSRADLLSHQGMIKQVVERRVMPPWFAAPTASGEATRWSNDRSLADADKRDLLAWFAAGAPEGDQADAPLQKVFPKDWVIGEPDVVLQLPREVSVKAEGTMPYQNLIVPTNFGEDRWVVAAEV
ncbi:MAG TPA: redoxin family protein, partial [Pirellulaceae bacterium]|nr:redoxin family protein [Pirellulaceae bacterium]